MHGSVSTGLGYAPTLSLNATAGVGARRALRTDGGKMVLII
jgi:hypothetical protein